MHYYYYKMKIQYGLENEKRKKDEDSLTSSVFNILKHHPDWLSFLSKNILEDHKGHNFSNARIKDFQFWPKWDPTGTENVNFVEPDLFIGFDSIGIIVEAKYGAAQDGPQWEKEIIAYFNEFPTKKKLILIALDGNSNPDDEYIEVGDKKIWIYKSSWQKIIFNLQKYKSVEDSHFLIKSDLMEVFRYFGFHTGENFDSLPIVKIDSKYNNLFKGVVYG